MLYMREFFYLYMSIFKYKKPSRSWVFIYLNGKL